MRYYIYIFLFFLVGCKRNFDNSLPVFDLEKKIGVYVPDTFVWNDITKQITYIAISDSSDVLLGGAKPLYAGKDFFYVVDHKTSSLVRIDKNGDITQCFSRKGQGPGEYKMISFFHFNESDSTVYLFDQMTKKCIVCDWNGNFVKEFSLRNKGFDLPLFMNENYVVLRGSEKMSHRIFLTDSNWAVQSGEFPFKETLTGMERLCLIWQLSMNGNQDRAYIHFTDGDTIYTVDSGVILPFCLINKGKYKLPYEQAKLPREMKPSPYIQDIRFFVVPDYFFITYMRENRFYDEVWSMENCQIISRFSNEDKQLGVPLMLPSGEKIKLDSRLLYVSHDMVIASIDAITAKEGGVENVKEDGNPVLVIMKL